MTYVGFLSLNAGDNR